MSTSIDAKSVSRVRRHLSSAYGGRHTACRRAASRGRLIRTTAAAVGISRMRSAYGVSRQLAYDSRQGWQPRSERKALDFVIVGVLAYI